MTSFMLKLIALISMIIDHTGHVFYPNSKIFGYLGRLAFPLFAFQIVEGYYHTKNINRYVIRLFLLAIISQYPFHMVFNNTELHLNTVFTLLSGLIGIIIYNKNRINGLFFMILLIIITSYIHFDYGFLGILLIFCFFKFKNKKPLMITSFIIIITGLYCVYISKYNNQYPTIKLIKYYLPYYLSTLLAIPLILLYNNKQGPKFQLLYYFVYPMHLILLAILKLILI